MKNTPANRNLLNRLQTLCEDTNYEMHIRESNEELGAFLRTRSGASEYTPDFYFEDHTSFGGGFRIEVQTTSYGPLAPEAIRAVATELMAAAQLANDMSLEIQLAGYRVYTA